MKSNSMKSTGQPRLNVCAVLKHADGSSETFLGKNTVTNDGDKYYAIRGAAKTPASNENFATPACVLQNPSAQDTLTKADAYQQVSNPLAASGEIQGTADAAYPKADDTGNSENGGAFVDAVTYKFSWTTAQINTSSGQPIRGGCIFDVAVTSPVNATKLLTHWNFDDPAFFHKTDTDTLTLYVNHRMNGT